MIAFTKLLNERLDKMHQILSEDHHTILSIVDAVTGLKKL